MPRSLLVWPLLIAAACGDISTVSSDAGSPDAADAAPAAGTVSVELIDPLGSGGEPLVGSTLLIVTPDGAVIGEDEVDADGHASVEDVPAGSIALIFVELMAGGEGTITFAVFDVQPGDVLSFGRDEPQGELVGNMTVELPAHADAGTYHAANGCQSPSGGTSLPMTFYQYCVVDDDVDVLAWVADAGGEVVAFLPASRPFMDATPIDLTAQTWQGTATLDIALGDIPPEAASVSVRVDRMLGARAYDGLFEMDDVPTTDDELAFAVAVPSSFGDSSKVELAFSPNQPSLGEQALVVRTDEALELSLADELLPWYASAVYAAEDRRLTWSRTGGRAPDVHYVLFNWVEDGGGEGALFMVAPPDRDEVILPEVPEEWASRLPQQPGATMTQLYAAEVSGMEWDDARQSGFDLVANEDTIDRLPVGSTLRLSLGAGSEI